MTTVRRSSELGSGRLLSARRALISLSAGLGAGVIVGFLATLGLLPLVTWTVMIAILLTWVWWMSWPLDSERTKRLAEQESSTMSMDVWLLAAALASLAVVVVALVQSNNQRNATDAASVLLSLLSVALSWALVNTVYAFKYARHYYFDEPDLGGIDFKQNDPPAYSDSRTWRSGSLTHRAAQLRKDLAMPSSRLHATTGLHHSELTRAP